MDQRLDLFPGLIDPLLRAPPQGPVEAAQQGPREPSRHDEETSAPLPDSPPSDPAASPRARFHETAGQNATLTRDSARQRTARDTHAARDAAGSAPPAQTPAPPAASPWQRLAEAAPLAAPLRRSDLAALFRPEGPGEGAASSVPERLEHVAQAPDRSPDQRRSRRREAEDARDTEARAQPYLATPDAPWPIPADALQPVGALETATPAVQPGNVSEPPRIVAAEPPRRAEPAAPPQDRATSPLSALAQTPTVMPRRAEVSATAGSGDADTREVRVVERIREVPAAPPPKRLTAAEASVIGPLKGRRIGSRHFRFGRL